MASSDGFMNYTGNVPVVPRWTSFLNRKSVLLYVYHHFATLS